MDLVPASASGLVGRGRLGLLELDLGEESDNPDNQIMKKTSISVTEATALEHGDAVATFNKRQFSQTKGLSVVEPT